jgi:hypothetical protein
MGKQPWCLTWLFVGLASSAPARADQLNLAGYHLTFDETFSRMDISAYGPGSRWIAHTPWRGDFGNDVFGNPGPGGPFSLTSQGLAIKASKNEAGNWQAGLISSMDMDGPDQAGFAQKYGYFEMRAKLPDGPGTWPAFWLVGTDTTHGTAELDVFEYYGHDNSAIHSTEHFWVNGKDEGKGWTVLKVPAGSLTAGFNDYGILITADRTVFYLNGTAYWSTETPTEYKQPMYVLVDLAIGGGWPFNRLYSPQEMTVQYVRVYQRDGASH